MWTKYELTVSISAPCFPCYTTAFSTFYEQTMFTILFAQWRTVLSNSFVWWACCLCLISCWMLVVNGSRVGFLSFEILKTRPRLKLYRVFTSPLLARKCWLSFFQMKIDLKTLASWYLKKWSISPTIMVHSHPWVNRQRNFDGAVLDLGGYVAVPQLKPVLFSFYGHLAQELHAMGKELILVIPVRSWFSVYLSYHFLHCIWIFRHSFSCSQRIQSLPTICLRLKVRWTNSKSWRTITQVLTIRGRLPVLALAALIIAAQSAPFLGSLRS